MSYLGDMPAIEPDAALKRRPGVQTVIYRGVGNPREYAMSDPGMGIEEQIAAMQGRGANQMNSPQLAALQDQQQQQLAQSIAQRQVGAQEEEAKARTLTAETEGKKLDLLTDPAFQKQELARELAAKGLLSATGMHESGLFADPERLAAEAGFIPGNITKGFARAKALGLKGGPGEAAGIGFRHAFAPELAYMSAGKNPYYIGNPVQEEINAWLNAGLRGAPPAVAEAAPAAALAAKPIGVKVPLRGSKIGSTSLAHPKATDWSGYEDPLTKMAKAGAAHLWNPPLRSIEEAKRRRKLAGIEPLPGTTVAGTERD